MLIPDYDNDKFLYKVKKWGELNPDIRLLMYTDHTKEMKEVIPYHFSVIIMVREYLEFTQKLGWLKFFGKVDKYSVTHTDEESIIEVNYEDNIKVKYVVVESNTSQNKSSEGDHKILMNKKKKE
ncbi:hypothetical protein [Zobellia uliginosa]|uniref:hypothetical protein n=1 Tax=Zobellia uliginosa TaxID=143224 RepID=UPI001C07516D|nr:hypothetical protein [Zobellia uliginosa]MBU2948324.1 hypothetical protein [Zobellia uliginosa]